MKIKVSQTILSGNLFDDTGYDEYASADNLAKITKKRIEEGLSNDYPEADIDVNIYIQHASGYGSHFDVDVECDDDEYDKDTVINYVQEVYKIVSQDIWENEWDDWAVKE